MIDHGGGYVTLYGHNYTVNVSYGQKVAQGQQIAIMGTTGNSTGAHCHFEVRVSGSTVNPANYIKV
ncbi:Murein hydrolase activator NlpD [bioreactor metagenome]|uniref:Murein hydrolase activator NlpD n=1 Tax=bioreactor metagenome TaxID=1076179 RepID=A0A645DD66_9ZZZZ